MAVAFANAGIVGGPALIGAPLGLATTGIIGTPVRTIGAPIGLVGNVGLGGLGGWGGLGGKGW